MKSPKFVAAFGAACLVFAIPIIFLLSSLEPTSSSIMVLALTAIGVGGLWLAVSKGVEQMGDGTLAGVRSHQEATETISAPGDVHENQEEQLLRDDHLDADASSS